MTAIVRRSGQSMFPELFEWLDGGWPFGTHPVHVEEYFEDSVYVLRAELPGLDPEREIEVTANDGMLLIAAHREEDKRDKQRSEFRYGSFTRTVRLPEGADLSQVKAGYTNGILEVRIPVQHPKEPHRIPVTAAES
ncbi:Hsp20/alpha crystallin family protein [Allokutzneria oryzae]|uniref:Hsp20/alpha crystallin family protein n=1 Tax=Allokutzneria oryzae TaxID=1378989 RepID=A0ABV6A388_9PSEU